MILSSDNSHRSSIEVERTIKDLFGRPVDNLRVSVTQRCNLRCFYCHKEGEVSPVDREMTEDEIERIVRIARDLGIAKVKLTGGEPLMRPKIVDIVRKLSSLPLLREVAMTTNGIFLNQLAQSLKTAGLKRINVSLGSLNSHTYKAITGVDALPQVIAGIKAAGKVGLSPIKVNMVILKGVNEKQISAMIEFTRQNELILQLIEFETPDTNGEYYIHYHTNMTDIEQQLERRATKIETRRLHKRKRYLLKDGGEVEVVRPMHNTTFCNSCSRLRITSDGKFKPCLFRTDNLVDFLTPLRSGATDKEIEKLLFEAVQQRQPFFT
ncbi:MAG: GTP 3',8-cyclase MoaA [Candidatus Bathyarchaeota archaeon]|nr:MAG: GTP 3',8-cyclase MoaA [Candidatus Bathyarchaeota archaeon]